LERVKQCIQERQYADQQDKNGYTALYLALEQNNREMMEYLLDHRASIDFDTDVPSPLIIAAMRHQLDLIELLASKGANMNTMYKKHHILEIFIAVKAPAVDGEELPSGEEIKLNTMRTLCKLGSDPSIYYKEVIQKNQNSYPAFYLALAARDLRAFELFCAYSKNIENIEGLNCETLLHMVVLAESHSKAETTVLDTMMNMLLTETKIFINAETDDGDTPLHTAASLGKLDVVKQLIDAGADVHVKNVDHLTPFMTAIINNQYDCAAYLVSKGAMPNSRSNTMKTALHLLFDSHELNRLNPTNKPSPTDRLNLARGLIERLRLNPNLTDDSNKTARDHAVQNELIKFYPQSVSYHHLQ
jgi:ankyrin repeat protein